MILDDWAISRGQSCGTCLTGVRDRTPTPFHTPVLSLDTGTGKPPIIGAKGDSANFNPALNELNSREHKCVSLKAHISPWAICDATKGALLRKPEGFAIPSTNIASSGPGLAASPTRTTGINTISTTSLDQGFCTLKDPAEITLPQNCKIGQRPMNHIQSTPIHAESKRRKRKHWPCPPHHSPSSLGRLAKRPRMWFNWFSNIAWILWFCDSIWPWSWCDWTEIWDCKDAVLWTCWLESSWTWPSIWTCFCINCWTWSSRRPSLSGTSSCSIGCGSLAMIEAWVLDSICWTLSAAVGPGRGTVTGWNFPQGSCFVHGSSSLEPPPQSARVEAEAMGCGMSCRSMVSPDFCLVIKISPWLVCTMELGGSSTAWTTHMAPRPGCGVAGWSGLHCHWTCFMARLIPCRSSPKGKGPTI